MGHGPGLSDRKVGSKGGGEKVTLTTNQLASHTHDWNANTAAGDSDAPVGRVTAGNAAPRIYRAAAQSQALASTTITNAGGGQSHNNLMPTLCINFIIALFGIYPSRN